MHHLSEEFLIETWGQMNKAGASGIDHMKMEEYGRNLKDNVSGLVLRLRQNRYRAPAVRRVEIPKNGGRQDLLEFLPWKIGFFKER